MLPTLEDFQEWTANKYDLVVDLFERGVLDLEWCCRHGTVHKANAESFVFRCRCGGSDHQRSIFRNSYFWGLRLPIARVLDIAYEWLCDSRISVAAERQGVSRKTVSTHFKWLRKMASTAISQNPVTMGGDDKIVCIDEMRLIRGKKKIRSRNMNEIGTTMTDAWHVRRRLKSIWIVGAVERSEERRLHLAAIKNRSVRKLKNALNDVIAQRTTVITDGLKAYKFVCRSLQLQQIIVRRNRHHVHAFKL